jgi:hypothetical protein
MIDCSWKHNLGIECPGCGFQRSVAALFEGDFLQSFYLFPATIPLLLTFLLTALHLYFKWKHGAWIIVGCFSLSALLMIISFVIKIAQHGVMPA